MSKKASIQEKILRLLHGKKAIKRSDIHDSLSEALEGDFEAKTKPKYAINRSLKALSEGGLVEEHETENSSFLRITPEGRQKLRNIKLSSPTSLISTHWDGYWRMVMLDLPESRKSERNSLRYILKKAGFVMLKNSVWVSPYPLEHLFMNIKKDMGLSSELIITVTQLIDPETEAELIEAFGFKTK
jgi:DNA-binding transcriptional regulator PaaX